MLTDINNERSDSEQQKKNTCIYCRSKKLHSFLKINSMHCLSLFALDNRSMYCKVLITFFK